MLFVLACTYLHVHVGDMASVLQVTILSGNGLC